MLCAPPPGTTIRAPMTTDRSAALALTAGSLAGLVIMALHPTGGDVARDATGGALRLAKAVHWVAIVAQPLVLAGTLAITLRLRTRRDLAVGAFISFAVASICVILAAAASGIVSTGVYEGMHDTGAGDMTSVENFGHYTFLWNQAFASIYVLALTFSAPLSEPIALGAVLHAVGVIEKLVLALPPVDPDSGAKVIRLVTAGRS